MFPFRSPRFRRVVRSHLRDWDLTELLANVVRHVPDRRCTLPGSPEGHPPPRKRGMPGDHTAAV
ncbi:hypothetical protein GCM10023323_05750 [Streptomyces thinghirensis]|uniref:Transposase n=1 Tax=Streptomyces thinghirensis TaxID=551547 RepID=A0ABP9SUR5_9ACTN